MKPRKRKEITGRSNDAKSNAIRFAKARAVRSQLLTFTPQRIVAKILGLKGKSNVDIIELRALSKIIKAFEQVRISNLTSS